MTSQLPDAADLHLCIYYVGDQVHACGWRVDEDPAPAVVAYVLDEDLGPVRQLGRVRRAARHLGVHPGATWSERALWRALSVAHFDAIDLWRTHADPRETRWALRRSRPVLQPQPQLR